MAKLATLRRCLDTIYMDIYVQMTTAGWSALVGTKIKGAPPEPVRASGAATRSQLASTQGSASKVTSALDQARTTLVAAIQQSSEMYSPKEQRPQ